MAEWIDVNERLPEEKEPVTIRVRSGSRPGYYRIADRWYCIHDLDRWRMNTSPYWEADRSWYLETEQIEGWKQEEGARRGG